MSFLSRRTAVSLCALLSLLTLQSGCATNKNQSVLWHSRDQFVALANRDDPGAERQPNQQPVTLSPRKVGAELAALQVKYPGENKARPLFEEGELQILSEQLPAALQQARPEQDLVFAVYGKAPVSALLKNWVTEEVVTTGRVFYRDNSLNLILGMVREKVRETDRRLQPFVPPTRGAAVPMPGAIGSASAQVLHADNRADWLVIPVPVATAADLAQPEPPTEVTPPTTPAAFGTSKGTPPAPKTIEERLRVLGELKAKGLITDEEYRAKKESILKEL